jgi:myo-inositol 2-dehydrogenase/D-chiro-inositol 1-dehydrogenase
MRHRARRVTHYTAGQVVESQMYAGWFERMQPTYALALDHFVQLLETGAPIEPSLLDGLKAQAIAEAATKSLHTGVSERIVY